MIKKIIVDMKVFYLITIFFIFLAGCNLKKEFVFIDENLKTYFEPYKVGKTWYHSVSIVKNFQQEGIASWYGKSFHGKKTSNGELYNMHRMTAAHKNLPVNSWIIVKNVTNNKCVEVKINDRGPFNKNRIIDLSYAAAKKVGMIEKGIVNVKITFLGFKN